MSPNVRKNMEGNRDRRNEKESNAMGKVPNIKEKGGVCMTLSFSLSGTC